LFDTKEIEMSEKNKSKNVVTEKGENLSTPVAAKTEAVATTAQAVESSRSSFRKFASAGDKDANPYGITNSRGEIVTSAYLRRYVQCWCRQGDGFVKNRNENFAYFDSPEFLGQHVGKTASQIGKIASQDERWGKPSVAAVNAAAEPVA
jgi:hypothetical protein